MVGTRQNLLNQNNVIFSQDEWENQILYLAVDVGKLLVESGAEIYRVEEVISRISMNYGLESATFVILTCIIC